MQVISELMNKQFLMVHICLKVRFLRRKLGLPRPETFKENKLFSNYAQCNEFG